MSDIPSLPGKLVDYLIQLRGCTNAAEKIQLGRFIWIALIMIGVSFAFTFYHFLTDNHTIAVIDAIFMAAVIVSLACIPYVSRVTYIYNAANLAYFLLMIALVMVDEQGSGRLLWLYTYPLFCLFILGFGQGVIWSFGLLFSTIVYLELFHSNPAAYAEGFRLRFYITYVLNIWIISWLEYERSRHVESLESQGKVLREENERRARLEDRLTELATVDQHTGVFNRYFFWELATKEFSRAKRYHSVVTLVLIDLDKFKQVNDTYGHPAGDLVLKITGHLLKESLRKSDVAARVGGEEFAVILPQTEAQQAYRLMTRIREEIAQYPFISNGSRIRQTVSIGIVSYSDHIPDIEHMYSLADSALYQAKENGRNRIEVAFPGSDQSSVAN